MRLNNPLLLIALLASSTEGFAPLSNTLNRPSALHSTAVAADLDEITIRQKLTFRELQRYCKEAGLGAKGTTAVLRERLLEFHGCLLENDEEECRVQQQDNSGEAAGIQFQDESDPDFDKKQLIKTISAKIDDGHWKAVTRKMKKLTKYYLTDEDNSNAELEDLYQRALRLFAQDRLHGARASEPARKLMEEMAIRGWKIPVEVGNECIKNSLGSDDQGKHDGCGGIDSALAMLNAVETSCSVKGVDKVGFTTTNSADSYSAVIHALCVERSCDEALMLLKSMIVDHSFTPELETFAEVAKACVLAEGNHDESVLNVLTLTKAAGYELDNIAAIEAGRQLLASGVIAAERMDNLPLGLRLLTAAQKAEGCLPDRGDDLVCSSSKLAQRASTLIHRRAIDRSIEDNNWKLSVRLFELMPERSLTPSSITWRKVVTTCAKAEKSRKATSLLMEWVELSKEGKVEPPPLNVFNTVVNACEICGEEALTLAVLELMKNTLGTEGNIITFNIALKRLAKQGNTLGCEGIIMGMIDAGLEPSVVTYTTAIAACVQAKDTALATEWLKRMRFRGTRPNTQTYNTVLAACLGDKSLDGVKRGSLVATQMIADVSSSIEQRLRNTDIQFKAPVPDVYSKFLSKELMKQLRESWRGGEIDMKVAKATLRVPLLKIVDFENQEMAEKIRKEIGDCDPVSEICEDGSDASGINKAEEDIEYEAVNRLHKETHRMAEV